MLRFLPLLLLILTLGCLVGASGEEEAPQDAAPTGISSSAQASIGDSANAVLIATVTPIAERPASRLAVLPSPTSAGATATPSATATEEALEAQRALVPTETPEPPTEVPTEVATETPSATETPAPTETITPSPSLTATATASPSPTATATATATPVTPTPVVSASGFRATLLAGHNQVRSQNGLSSLSLNGTLNQLAQERAEIMASMDVMTHYNPNGTTVFEMMTAQGYPYTDGAENIGWNIGYSASRSVEMVMQQWIESPPHYANMVKGHLTLVGFGMATSSSGKVYYSAVFSD